MTTGSADVPLTAFQLEVAQLFFSLPASDGFVLAGGAALLAQHLTVRPTYAPEELAGRKVVALFDRFAARDFVDVYALSNTYSKADLLT